MIGAFDDLKCTFDGAFKQPFGLGLSGELEKFMPKQLEGMLHFDLTKTLTP